MPLFGGGYWAIFLIALVLGLITQGYVNSTYRRYSAVPVPDGRSGAEVARAMLDSNGLQGVGIEMVGGSLSDHFDPRAGVLRLSRAVYEGRNVAAAGVASHEAGHAVQHARGFVFARARSALVPVASFGSRIWVLLLLAGLWLDLSGLVWAGIVLFGASVVFSLITLPVEFDASRRALASLEGGTGGISLQTEGARKVLTAAALTYVAAALVSLLQFFYFLGLARRR